MPQSRQEEPPARRAPRPEPRTRASRRTSRTGRCSPRGKARRLPRTHPRRAGTRRSPLARCCSPAEFESPSGRYARPSSRLTNRQSLRAGYRGLTQSHVTVGEGRLRRGAIDAVSDPRGVRESSPAARRSASSKAAVRSRRARRAATKGQGGRLHRTGRAGPWILARSHATGTSGVDESTSAMTSTWIRMNRSGSVWPSSRPR